MGEWVCLERPNGCHPGSLEGRVSYGRGTACASFLRRTYNVYTSFLWATYAVRMMLEDAQVFHKAGSTQATHPPLRETLPPSQEFPSLTHSCLHSSTSSPSLSPPWLYSSSWSSPQCDQHLWMITADLLLGSELQAMQNQFILLRCHPASRFIIITSIEIIIINTFYNVNIK